MENTVLKDTRKQFSRIGLVLFLGTLLIYGVQILFSVAAYSVPAIAENGSLSFLAMMLPMYIIAFPLIFLMFKKVPVQTGGEKKKMPASHLLIAFLISYATVYLGNILGNILTSIISLIKQNPVQNVMMNVTGNISPAVNFFIIVICAPIMEELLFRKALIDRTAGFGEGVAMVFSGLVFGLFHGNLVQFGYAFCLGMLFAFIYIKTRNILYPIILHMLTNFLGSFLSSLVLEKSGYMEILESTSAGASEAELLTAMMDNMGGLVMYFLYVMCILGIVIAGIVLFCVNRKKFTLSAGEVVIEKGQRFKTILLNVGMILYCAFWIIQIIVQLAA